MSHEKDGAEEQKKIDLMLENQSLEREVLLRGGSFWSNEEMDPEMKNQFLKNVVAYENFQDEPEVPMCSLFPDDYEFPPVESMTEEELSRKLDDIADIFAQSSIELGYSEEVPDSVLYKHLVEDCIPNDKISIPQGNGAFWVLDGCTGFCEECFQKDYCETGQELMAENEQKGQ